MSQVKIRHKSEIPFQPDFQESEHRQLPFRPKHHLA